MSDNNTLRLKRTQTLLGVWNFLIKKEFIDETRLSLSQPLIAEVVEHYISDREILKCRYKINNHIQLHKVAGLVASHILKFRPIIPLVSKFKSDQEIYANEYYAIFHGLSICSEFEPEEEKVKLMQEEWFENWFRNFIFLTHHRNYTSESLIFIFETLCYFKFPKGLATNCSN